jgi:serine/threonine-protein kinase RIO1
MGYIHEFEQKLAELLTRAGMDEATRKEVLTYVKRTVVESYKNGIEAGKAASVVRAVERQSRTAVRK